MAKKQDRRLVACEQCESVYPGFLDDQGTMQVVGGPACPNCGGSELTEIEGVP